MGLMLHAGAHAIDRNALAALPLPEARGSRHVIRPFIEDIELVEHYLGRNGLIIAEEAFGTKVDGKGLPTQFFGAMEVKPKILTEAIKPSNTDHPHVLGAWNRTLPLTEYLDRGVSLIH